MGVKVSKLVIIMLPVLKKLPKKTNMVRKKRFRIECHVFDAAAYTYAVPVYTFYVITQEYIITRTRNRKSRKSNNFLRIELVLKSAGLP